MRRLVALTLIVLAGFSTAPGFCQSFGDMDSSGRFGGMPPGTDRYRQDYDQGGIAIPLDPIETGNVTGIHRTERSCPRPDTREWRAQMRNGTLSDECR